MASVGTCIECGEPLAPALVIEERGTPHGDPGHSYVFSEQTLGRCATGHGQLESYSHDCWDYEDDWDLYWWFLLSAAATAELLELARACPRPLAGTCECAVHRSLRESSERLSATRGAISPSGERRAARIALARDGDLPRLVLAEPLSIV